MSLTINNQTDLSQIARFVAEKGKDEVLLAKKDGEGNTVLYTRSERALEGARGRLTAFKERVLSKAGRGKAALAQREIAKFVDANSAAKGNVLLSKTNQLGQGRQAVLDLHSAMKIASENIATTKMNAGDMGKVLSALELLSGTVTRLVEQKANLQDGLPSLPVTNNRPDGNLKEWMNASDQKVTTYDLQIDGKKFEAKELLGTGGNGTVFRYEAEDGSMMAVKIVPNIYAGSDSDRMNEAATRELGNTNRLVANNPHATGATQHVIMPNGLIALAGSVMPNGDLTQLGEKIVAKLSNLAETPAGQIGSLERDLIGLTLLQDAASGLAGMHENNQVSHGDVKSQNVMLDSNGIAKLIDLGESSLMRAIRPQNINFTDSPLYRAPEVTNMEAIDKNRSMQVRAANTEMFDFLMTGLADTLPSDGNSQLDQTLRDLGKSMAKNLNDFARTANNSDLTVGNTFDSFGLGTLGFELLGGGRATKEIEGQLNNSEIADVIEEWRTTGNDFIGEGGIATQGNGDTQIDSLLNGMLSSDPKTRLTAAQVRDHPLMQTAGVGSPAVRELIVALAKGDPNAIDTARDKIREQFGKL